MRFPTSQEPKRSGSPSTAKNLISIIASKRTVTKLHIGYCGGGERAQGQLARNAHITSAPVAVGHELHPNHASTKIPTVPHVEYLTFENCWRDPLNIESLLKLHCKLNLEKLTLESVSLIAHPGAPRMSELAFEPDRWSSESRWLEAIWNRVPLTIYYQLLSHERRFCPPSFEPRTWEPQSRPPGLHWTEGMRPGSWANLLDRFSRGPNLKDYSNLWRSRISFKGTQQTAQNRAHLVRLHST